MVANPSHTAKRLHTETQQNKGDDQTSNLFILNTTLHYVSFYQGDLS